MSREGGQLVEDLPLLALDLDDPPLPDHSPRSGSVPAAVELVLMEGVAEKAHLLLVLFHQLLVFSLEPETVFLSDVAHSHF